MKCSDALCFSGYSAQKINCLWESAIIWLASLQDSGTAIWLFAWFGYWLEVIFVLSVRAIKGSLLSAKQDKGSRGRQSELPLGVKGMPDARSGGDSPTTARANTKAAGPLCICSVACFT